MRVKPLVSSPCEPARSAQNEGDWATHQFRQWFYVDRKGTGGALVRPA